MRPLSPEELRAKAFAVRDQLQPRLPTIDPGDLLLIVQSVLRPIGTGRRFFLREVRRGVRVP